MAVLSSWGLPVSFIGFNFTWVQIIVSFRRSTAPLLEVEGSLPGNLYYIMQNIKLCSKLGWFNFFV